MNISDFAFRLLLLFFPGIICTYIVDQLTVHRPREKFFFLLSSFVFGLMSYFEYKLFYLIPGHHFFPNYISAELLFLKALTDSTIKYSFEEIALVTICAIITAMLFSIGSRFKLLNKVAHTLRLSKQFGELDVWGYMLNIKEVNWVTVRDHANDLIYDGWVQAFSDDSKDAEMLLRDVSVYKNSTGEPLYQVGALYISRRREDISIECRTIPVDEMIKWKENNKNE